MNTTNRTEIRARSDGRGSDIRQLSVFEWSNLVRKHEQESREEEMTIKLTPLKKRRQGGYVMISAMALTLVLIGIGAAFMQWASDESVQSQHNYAGIEAYYLAQTGVIESGLHWLRMQQAGLLPVSEMRLNGGEVVVDHESIGTYDQVKVAPVLASQESSNIFYSKRKFRISAVGTVKLPWYEDGEKTEIEVKRKAVLYVSVRSFSDYMYLTDHEVTPMGEVVRFWGGDTLWGRVHSNDSIQVMGRPIFYDLVTTGGVIVEGIGANPGWFGGDPVEHVPKIDIPSVATTVREGAEASGHIYNEPGQEYRLSLRGSSAVLFYWDEGAPFDSVSAHRINITNGGFTCIFVQGPLSMQGRVGLEWTIGCSEDIYLIDDVFYDCLDMAHDFTISSTCPDFCGIVSEKRVIIANTWANGRDNHSQGRDIVISAAVVALGDSTGSFTFDQQNDTWDTYIGPSPDDRGEIHLRGSVTQRFRGYVHRSNNGSTGYLKDYDYDDRFITHRPPCFFDAVDQSGRVKFDVVQWGQAVEDPNDVREKIFVRYN